MVTASNLAFAHKNGAVSPVFSRLPLANHKNIRDSLLGENLLCFVDPGESDPRLRNAPRSKFSPFWWTS